MAFRSRSRGGFRRAPRKRAIWVNIPFGDVAFTEVVGAQLLLTAEDWEAQFGGNANETAVLRRIVGTIVVNQTVAGTAGEVGFLMIYISDKDATVVPSFTTSDLGDIDIMHVDAYRTASSVTDSLTAGALHRYVIDIKAKRRLKSRDAIRLCLQFAADAASPAGKAGGILRFLVARD